MCVRGGGGDYLASHDDNRDLPRPNFVYIHIIKSPVTNLPIIGGNIPTMRMMRDLLE